MAQKRKFKEVLEGVVHIKATFNNTIVSVSDIKGDVKCCSSSGGNGFKNSRKGTPFGAQLASEAAAKKAMEEFGMRRVYVRVKGPGAGRESAIRGIKSSGLEIVSLEDCTPLPHNGCRPKKKRRV